MLIYECALILTPILILLPLPPPLPPPLLYLGRFVFDAAIASLLNERAGADPTLFPAFTVFDSYLPLAVAGLPIEHIKVNPLTVHSSYISLPSPPFYPSLPCAL